MQVRFGSVESANKPGLQVRYIYIYIYIYIYWVLWWKWTEKILVLKFIGWLGSELSLHELKMVSDLATMRKRAKRKTKISKVVILQLRLFENHTVVISLFLEKELPLEYLFLSWKKVLDERLSAKRNDFRESYISCFKENLKFVEKDL